MKTIIFVRDMKTEAQADRIRVALEDTRVEYKVALESGAVVIEGSNDLVYLSLIHILPPTQLVAVWKILSALKPS